jgi:hypothetical protein
MKTTFTVLPVRTLFYFIQLYSILIYYCHGAESITVMKMIRFVALP